MDEKPKGRIAAGVGVAVAGRGENSRRIQEAMSRGVRQAVQEGIENPKLVRRKMMAERQTERFSQSEQAERDRLARLEALERGEEIDHPTNAETK